MCDRDVSPVCCVSDGQASRFRYRLTLRNFFPTIFLRLSLIVLLRLTAVMVLPLSESSSSDFAFTLLCHSANEDSDMVELLKAPLFFFRFVVASARHTSQ